jgi:hypothetical protein
MMRCGEYLSLTSFELTLTSSGDLAGFDISEIMLFHVSLMSPAK